MSRTRENSVSGSPTSAEQVSVSLCSFMVFLCSIIVISYGGVVSFTHREVVPHALLGMIMSAILYLAVKYLTNYDIQFTPKEKKTMGMSAS
jgi:hypothetical protein